MPPTPYTRAAEHLGDQIDISRVTLRAAVRRRQLGDVANWDNDPELNRYLQAIAELNALSSARADASDPTMVPLVAIEKVFRLRPTEVRVVVFLIGLELDVKLRELARLFMNDPQRPHPDVGLLAELLYPGPERARVPEELGGDGSLVRFGLISIDRLADTAFVLRRVRAVERIIELAHGRDVIDRDLARVVELIRPKRRTDLVLDGNLLDELVGLVGAAVDSAKRGTPHPVILLSGHDGSGRKAFLASAAAHNELGTLRVRAKALPRDEASLRELGPRLLREAIWWNAMLVLDGVDQLSVESTAFRADEILFGGYSGPLAATCGKITGKPPQMGRGTVVVEVPVPGEVAREQLWGRALPAECDAELARWAAERYFVTPGVIEAAAQAATAKARARAGADEELMLVAPDIHEGLRGVLDAKLATLGMRITWRQTWDDLVLPDDAVLEIREFIARIRHRRLVYDSWGFGRKVAKGLGLSALFSGPPGTGKTMVAGLIAEELKLDLYQVDLSKVVSKWIGETEKNLGELFDAAEAGHAILLFDEADSLFAKRTEVKSSNDRYANLEVNYLLQRMESFAGIVILTTNHETSIDEAFRRRLSLRVDFPVPEPDERARLWRTMLPKEARIDRDIDFDALAHRYEMTGGYIKNAALRAAFLAADEGALIAMRHLVRAARAEYQAMGKVISQL
ncbi:MAG: ATP-binding protein [Kofleriaceae bacterium]